MTNQGARGNVCPAFFHSEKQMASRSVSWISIDFDVETYLANGGKLLNVGMGTPEEIACLEAMASSDELSDEMRNRIDRVGRFLQLLGSIVGSEQKVGDWTEEEVLRIWRKTRPSTVH